MDSYTPLHGSSWSAAVAAAAIDFIFVQTFFCMHASSSSGVVRPKTKLHYDNNCSGRALLAVAHVFTSSCCLKHPTRLQYSTASEWPVVNWNEINRATTMLLLSQLKPTTSTTVVPVLDEIDRFWRPAILCKNSVERDEANLSQLDREDFYTF